MIGWLDWTGERRGRCPVRVGETLVLHVRFVRAEVCPGAGVLTWRRVRQALGRLRKLGVTETVLPEGFPRPELVRAAGLRPVSTLALRRQIGADWLREALRAAGKGGRDTTVAVALGSLTGEAVRTVTELCLRYRYVLLDAERGGEELAARLRREYGAAVQLSPTAEQVRQADGALLWEPRDWQVENGVTLRLWEEEAPLPPLLLPPALEEQLPAGADREQLLAALCRAGALRPGHLAVGCVQGGREGENRAASGDLATESLQFPGQDRP